MVSTSPQYGQAGEFPSLDLKALLLVCNVRLRVWKEFSLVFDERSGVFNTPKAWAKTSAVGYEILSLLRVAKAGAFLIFLSRRSLLSFLNSWLKLLSELS